MAEPTRINFTKAALAAIKPPSRGRLYVYDTRCPGLALCVTDRGAKTFYRCGRVSGRFERYRIGTFEKTNIEDARKAAAIVGGRAARGESLTAGTRTLSQLHEWYMEHHSRPHKRTADRDDAHFKLYLAPWANRRLGSLKRADVQALIARVKLDKGPGAANNVLVLLRTMLNRGVEDGFVTVNVTHGIKQFPRRKRERFLTVDEVPRFFEALRQIKREGTRDFFLVALFTGGRRQNVLSMRWDELDLAQAFWLIPASKFKNNEAQGVPLSPEVLVILLRRFDARDEACPWVFPGQSKAGHLNEPKAAWKRLMQISGLKNLVLHDLRRTLGSWQAATGTSLPIIGKTLGHRSAESTQIYARLDLIPVRTAVNRATAAISAAATGTEETK